MVTKMEPGHSHDIFDEETFKLCAPKRKLTLEENKAYTMVKAGADAKLVSAIQKRENV